MDCAKEVYSSLTPEEKTKISYPDFIDKVAQEYSATEESPVDRGTGYKRCRKYYYDHKLTKKNPRAKDRRENISYNDIQPLLDYDTRREQLLNALGEKFRYSWFSKNVYIEDNTKKSRIFLVIESDDKTIKNVYDILIKTYTDMFKSIYLGFGGLVMIFYNKSSFENFIEYIKKDCEK